MPINPIFDRLLELLTTEKKQVLSIGLRPRVNYERVVYELNEGPDDEVTVDQYSKEQVDYWYSQTRLLWQYISQIKIPEIETQK